VSELPVPIRSSRRLIDVTPKDVLELIRRVAERGKMPNSESVASGRFE
jgi:hypothetical protein